MRQKSLLVVSMLLSLGLIGCGDKGAGSGEAIKEAASEGKMIDFVTTQDGAALKIDPKVFPARWAASAVGCRRWRWHGPG